MSFPLSPLIAAKRTTLKICRQNTRQKDEKSSFGGFFGSIPAPPFLPLELLIGEDFCKLICLRVHCFPPPPPPLGPAVVRPLSVSLGPVAVIPTVHQKTTRVAEQKQVIDVTVHSNIMGEYSM